ncbi:UbiA family prenyltransferase [Streptomyces sp. NPDC046197]|uniref:UbiA family prenyltransferase n=1 Tax=Streptomyces sp. NPDC046197 TaxID=3154337 RepID=UPI0033D8E8EB
MTTVLPQVPARLGRFVLCRFRPHLYATYGLLWVLALESSAVALTGTAWRPTGATWVRVVSVVLALLFLRMLDEQKDFEYDRVHHPDRPLVTGAITVAELRRGMAVLTVVTVALNAVLSLTAVLLILSALGYGLLLAALEGLSRTVRDRQLIGLAVACPVQLLLGVYVYGSLAAAGTVSVDWHGAVLLALCACVFLHFEFARKTAWETPPGARLYSADLGPRRSAAVTAGLAAGAVGCQIALFSPARPAGWLPCLMAALPAWGLARFLVTRRGGWPLSTATGFVVGTYLALVVRAVLLPSALKNR